MGVNLIEKEEGVKIAEHPVADIAPAPAVRCSLDLSDLSAEPPFRGVIENIDQSGASGWCFDIRNPAKPVSLSVIFLGVELGSTETANPRPDIQGIIGQPCAPAYRINWASCRVAPRAADALKPRVEAAPDAPAEIEIRTVDGGVLLPYLPDCRKLTNAELFQLITGRAGKALPNRSAASSPSVHRQGLVTEDCSQKILIEGHMDTIQGRVVHGWARQHDSHDPVIVQLYIDGALVGSTVASEARSDLTADGIGDHAYQIPIPAECYDGEVHRIEVRVANSTMPLVGSPQEHHLTLISDAAWSIDDRQINGWLVAIDTGTVDLDVRIDGSIVDRIKVSATAGKPEAFICLLSNTFVDDRRHSIEIVPAAEPRNPLRHSRGGTQAQFQKRIAYSIDNIDGGTITGWAFNRVNSDEALEIELYDGPVLINKTTTNITRQDVNCQFSIGGAHGFSLTIPARHFDGLPHTLALKANGEILTVPPKKQLPQRLTRSLISQRNDRYVGKVEHVSSHAISGWAADRLDPFRPVRVVILVDGVCEAIVVADQFQKRLQSVAGGGYHGFHYEFPSRLMNSSWRSIEARIVDGDAPLEIGKKQQSKADVFFPLIDFFAAYEQRSEFEDFAAPPLTNLISRLPAPAVPRQCQAADQGPRVTLVVLNWNGAPLLEQMLRSIAAHLSGEAIEVMVVDHGSQDESLAVAERFRDRLDLTVLARNSNFSFSSSNNYAARLAKGQYLFFVNNDIVFSGDCLPAMTDWLDRDPSVGIVGMRLVEPLPKDGSGWRFAPHHRGIQFLPKTLSNGDITYFPAELDDAYSELGAVFEMPAVTGAALLCRKDEFLAVGGFDEAYFYGLEDVDLCLRLASRLNKRIICDTTVTALHNRSYTRTARLQTGKPNPILVNPQRQTQNALIYAERTKRQVVRKALASLVNGETFWRTKPLRVTFVVTDASFTTPAGDFYTALEMAEAMRALYGWETLFVKRDVADMSGTDVLIVMRHDFDLGKVHSANPGMVSIAWIRNRVDEWLASPHFQSYNLLFCSSNLAIRAVAEATGRTAHLLPIATNEERFRAQEPNELHRTDIVFTGNYWGASRDAVELLDQIEPPGELAIYGHGWQQHERWRSNWRKAVPYMELPNIYPSAKLVIDDSHPVTREWNSLNSRVFDALGSGTLVATNCCGGAEELFGDRLPTFSTAEELTALLKHYLDHPEEREALAAQLHAEVLEKHTYKHRAQVFKDALGSFIEKALRFSIKVGIPNHDEKHSWGDWHFAQAIQRALHKAGHHARIDILPEWNTPLSVSDDVVIVLRGLSAYKPMPSKINLLWLISHPDEVAFSELDRYDHVFVASQPYTDVLRRRLGDRVSTLLQCTDPDVFHPDGDAPEPVPEVLFVGNSRGVRRPIVDDALQMGIDVGVYGRMWEGIIPHDRVLGTYLPNDGLRRYYENAKIILNDHWPDMKREGFISNRIFDAGACGATIVSDDIIGLHEIFDDCVVTYDGPEDLRQKIQGLLQDDAGCRAMGARLRQAILARHTFDHRVQDILATVKAFL